MRKTILLLCMLALFTSRSYGNFNAMFDGFRNAGMITSGITIVGITLTTNSDAQKQAKKEVAQYMLQNHVNLVRDISAANGPMITEWCADFHLSLEEASKFELIFEGSQEQITMLHSLKDEITLEDAELFSKSLINLMAKVVDENRDGN